MTKGIKTFNKKFFEGLPEKHTSKVPNGWGKQRYNGRFRRVNYDAQIDVNNKVKKRSFIQEFVTENISGTFLKSQRKKRDFQY
ncbi:MAG: hypothetical protein MI784_17725 [Cytophagales bacterium]|nr:hypothetical protein [Cytophagales bacterium]